MENNNNNKRFTWSLVGAIVVVVIIILAVKFGGSSSSSSDTDMGYATDTDATSTVTGPVMNPSDTGTPATTSTPTPAGDTTTGPSVSVGSPSALTFAYSVTVASSTYHQNEQIAMTVSVLNLSKTTQTLSFKNGCIGTYSIGDFNLSDHVTCLATPTSFTVDPGEVKQITLIHYPSVYMIPVGSYTLHASFAGYGGNSVPVTIVQ